MHLQCLEISLKSSYPLGKRVKQRDQLAVSVLCGFAESVLVIEQVYLTAIGENAGKVGEAFAVSFFDYVPRNAVTALLHAVFYTRKAFIKGIDTHIEKSDAVALFACFFRKQNRLMTGKGRFLRKIDALCKAILEQSDSRSSALKSIAMLDSEQIGIDYYSKIVIGRNKNAR